ncbi:hypothetical protein TVAG_423050 [Trichomonas vaginalis G3]|uniref:Ataxin-10 domain-containing protein n=1 Tax=Trichomonas vaginalis (strain ATCC PRA-98 / G3) TaxID=412133 RepID=A2DTE4_TRIV3|nr:serine/threonine-protein phosphatase 6 regulatory subunit family [Trichomonas vaginalis G3]EAY16253.1 hypothetical protein TVAG_423050 [Trichomonas vaginalis G3]KAI5523392.1 serine/threonine-protein phosphatase 6 regulatory subunit family [Trichomonas vaginalis G3]|eukprot:XP_001328476.1 hypothetical protein [Trichomonas vaginalis G3]
MDNFSDKLSTALKNPDHETDEILNLASLHPQVAAIDSNFIQFVLENMDEIFQLALGLAGEDNPGLQRNAFAILTIKVSSYISLLISSDQFLENLNETIESIGILEPPNLKLWVRMMNTLLDLTGFAILLNLPGRKKLFRRLLPHVGKVGIYEFLFRICDDGHEASHQFLEKTHSVTSIYNCLGNGYDLQIVKLLCACCYSDTSGKLILSLSRPERTAKIFSFAVSDNILLSNAAMQLLFEMSSHCDEDDEDDEDSLFQRVFMKIVERIDELIEFICKPPFTSAKFRAIDLIIGMISTEHADFDKILKVLKWVWDQTFANPLLSQIHCAMLRICKAIFDSEELPEEFVTQCQFRERIIEYSNKKCTFSGHLYEIARMIHEIEDFDKQSQAWKDYINGPYAKIRSIRENGYGGPVPERHKISISDYKVDGILEQTIQQPTNC